MFRIAALNESYSDDGSDGDQQARESTKEAKEAEAYSLYTKALGLLRHGDTDQAEEFLRDLIEHDFLQEAWETLEEKGSEAIHPGLQLLYSIQKNLASMATQRNDYKAAMESYLEAVKIDNSEVSVWYKMGMTALKLEDFQLAKVVFVEGLECNPKHWPCLDNLIPILYSLNCYYECLFYISKAFEMDLHYEKGHAFRSKMYKEQASLISYTEEFFKECDPEIHRIQLEPDDAKEYIEEALQMRRRRQELSKPPEPVRLHFPNKLHAYSWKHIGEVLVELYDEVVASDPPISMGLKVIIPDYADVLSVEEETANLAKETGTSVTEDVAKADEPDKDENVKTTAGDNQKSEKEEAMEVDEVLNEAKPETEKIFEDAYKGLKELTELEKPGSQSEAEKPFASYGNKESSKVEMDSDTPAIITERMEDDANESDSLLEAVNTAHSLIDSLSPGKAASPFVSEGSRPKVPQFSVDDQQDKNTCKETDKLDSQPPMVKCASYGFTVSDLLSPEAGSSKPLSVSTGTDIVTTSEAVVTNTLTTDSDGKGTSDSNKQLVPDITIKSAVSALDQAVNGGSGTKGEAASSGYKCVVTDSGLSDSTVTSVPLSSPSTGTFMISNLISTSALGNSSPQVSTSSPCTPVPSLPGYNNTTTNTSQTPTSVALMANSTAMVSGQLHVTTSLATSTQPSAISLYDSVQGRNSDHGYAKGSKDRPQNLPAPMLIGGGDSGIVSMATANMHGQMKMSSISGGSVPVTQSLQSSFEPSLVEAGLRSALAMDMDDRSPGGRKGQKRRRISMATEEIMMYGKRRSARVRNTGRKKEEETVNFTDLLMAFLPSTLKYVQEDDVTMETDKADPGPETSTKQSTGTSDSVNQEPALISTQQWEEETGVKTFLKSYQKNAGLIFLMNAYLYEMAKLCKVKWPDGLSEVYITVFNKVRKHLYMPCVFDRSDPDEDFQELSQICLVWTELVLDQWLVARAKLAGSPGFSPKGPSSLLTSAEIPAFYDEDILFLTILCGDSERLGSIWIDHCIRVYWMQARYLVLKGKSNEALHCFDRTKEYLEYGTAELGVEQAFLPNCKIDNIINVGVVGSQSEQLEKNQSVAETQRLYDSQEYDKVVDILLQTFSQAKSKIVRVASDPAERQSQLMLLQDALYKTKDYPKCLLWGEESFNETYQAYRVASKSDERLEWIKTMVQIFINLQSVVEKQPDIIQTLPSAKLVRLTQNLILVIDANMSLPESVQTPAIDTVLPWILLYLLIKHEEEKIQALTSSISSKDEDSKSDMEDNMGASDMLLNIAHDYLGSRGWCTKSDGALLLFIMKVLKEKMETESSFQEEYQQGFEQCVYCLYGHPNKRTKAKHLQDHNVTGITLEWQQAVDLFDYFKPKTVPEFDGYQSEKISTEMEGLLRRIILLVPETNRAMGLATEGIQNYIEGSVTLPPSIPEGKEVTLPVITEVYYLLADYYLKNKEFLKAIKFYILDLCMNPNRLDSWAGMALARMSQLESRLTSTELKMDTPIYKKSIAALRCFKRAVEIDDSNNKLWLEYGILAYQFHSHAARQLKWKKWFAMSEEMVQIALESKREMLQTAIDCYRVAAQCESEAQDEEWLHNYMQGKCLEKLGKPTRDVIPFYLKALESTHEENAKYPKKIVYSYTTPHLAVESLEMYFRIHVGILKTLMRDGPDIDDQDYIAFIKFVNETATCPFVRRVEKGQEGKTERESASSADESSCSAFNSPAGKKVGQGETSQSDHTYFRQKSNPGTPSTVFHGNTSLGQPLEVTSAVVKTFELHSDSQKSQEDIKLTKSECPKLPAREETPTEGNVGMDKQIAENVSHDNDSPSKTPFTIVNILGDSPADGKEGAQSDPEKRLDSTEAVVKNVLTHITDIIATNIKDTKDKENSSMGNKVDQSSEECSQEERTVAMEVDDEETGSQTAGDNKVQDNEEKTGHNDKTSPKSEYEEKGPAQEDTSLKPEDDVDVLMKKPRDELHKYLMERCRKALELCLQRFPTHYKSHYRLAYMYLHSPYHKDLTKAHHILLGLSKWKQYPYMPCQGLFGERKPTKFFQGIWKIPIDEIDRAGSFPSHLNKCIELILSVLKEERDSHTLHQIHLQLNRQPEPGKKYLRDAEKKYYALTSHRYTLDAVESQTEDMKKTSDMNERLKFLLNVYKIWEHGTHKLNKHVERTNRLLAEAYRVVIRKLETLPHNMLLDQAVRFCKHQLTQKHMSKTEKCQSQGIEGTSVAQTSGDSSGVKMPKLISLANIMKSQTNYSMAKANQGKQTELPTTEMTNKSQESVKATPTNPTDDPTDVIILSDSSEAETPKKVKSTEAPSSSAAANPKAPTVKIKMGLLQAVKRLKPAPGEGDPDSSDAKDLPKIPEDSESEAPMPSVSEAESDSDEGSSSSSSSSTSSSSSDDDDSSSSSSSEEDDSNNNEGNDNADDEDDDSESDDESEDSSDDNETKSTKLVKVVKTKQPKVQLKMKPRPVEEDEMDVDESSDSDGEIDLVSNEEKDDDKDEDYKASDDEDEDVIMQEEFSQRGRVVLPSPPHKKDGDMDTEVLVQTAPDLDPLISTLMSSEINIGSAGNASSVSKPVSVSQSVPAQRRRSSSGSSVVIID